MVLPQWCLRKRNLENLEGSIAAMSGVHEVEDWMYVRRRWGERGSGLDVPSLRRWKKRHAYGVGC